GTDHGHGVADRTDGVRQLLIDDDDGLALGLGDTAAQQRAVVRAVQREDLELEAGRLKIRANRDQDRPDAAGQTTAQRHQHRHARRAHAADCNQLLHRTSVATTRAVSRSMSRRWRALPRYVSQTSSGSSMTGDEVKRPEAVRKFARGEASMRKGVERSRESTESRP